MWRGFIKLARKLAEKLGWLDTSPQDNSSAAMSEELDFFPPNVDGVDSGNPLWGEQADNLEWALDSYKGPPNADGVDYENPLWGEQADNLEWTDFYNTALKGFTPRGFPEDWAMCRNQSNDFWYPIQGERVDNLEVKIASYNTVLEVYTREAFPYEWAMTQNNLGNAYRDRIRGERADNLEVAIASYNAALEVRTREAFPYEWAMTQNNLGIAYRKRIQGERADNLEVAIASYNAALEVRTREVFPKDWAMTQNNLGNAYRDRIRGERADNLEVAIASYNAALEVRTREVFPKDWAMTQNNLGNAYRERITGERVDNLEVAIASYNAALEVYTREAFSEEWAMTQNNLGIAYRDRIQGERADNLEVAIASYNAALEVYTREAFPYEWAGTQNNLGLAYRDLGQIPEALECFRLALTIRTPTALPLDCLQTGCNLGDTTFQAELWSDAIAGYDVAIQAVEQSCEWASSEATRQELRQDAIDVYTKIVQACINHHQSENAIEYIERSKARTLVELLANRNLSPKGDVPPALLNQLQQLKRELPAKRQLLATAQTLNSDAAQELRQEVSELQSQLQQVLAQIQRIDASYQLTQIVRPISYTEIHDLLDEHTAILLWYITSKRFFTFVITHQSPPYVWQSSADDLAELEQWGNDYLNDYDAIKREKNFQWHTQLASRLEQLSAILHLDEILSQVPKQCKQLILIPHRYLHLFPLHALPLCPHPQPLSQKGKGEQEQEMEADVSLSLAATDNPEQTAQQEIFLPLSPSGRGGWGVRANYLLDNFPQGIRYVPSCQLLQQVQQRNYLTPDVRHLFAIQNPTRDLRYTDIEVEIIKRAFHPNTHILEKEKATKQAITQAQTPLRDSHYAHFSCHGAFNFESPLQSALMLAKSVIPAANVPTDADSFREPTPATAARYQPWYDNHRIDTEHCLTLQEIFEHIDLPQCHLVTLSACETGLTDILHQCQKPGLLLIT